VWGKVHSALQVALIAFLLLAIVAIVVSPIVDLPPTVLSATALLLVAMYSAVILAVKLAAPSGFVVLIAHPFTLTLNCLAAADRSCVRLC
jgi:hypothetical protein